MDRRTFLKAVGAAVLLPSMPKSTPGVDRRMVRYTWCFDPATGIDEGIVSVYVDEHGSLKQLTSEEVRIFFEREN